MSEIKLPPLPAEYYLVCGRRTWDEKDMQEYARQAVREAVPEDYVVVPATPTNAMRDAGNAHVLSRSTLFAAWNAMISAAKEQP